MTAFHYIPFCIFRIQNCTVDIYLLNISKTVIKNPTGGVSQDTAVSLLSKSGTATFSFPLKQIFGLTPDDTVGFAYGCQDVWGRRSRCQDAPAVGRVGMS